MRPRGLKGLIPCERAEWVKYVEQSLIDALYLINCKLRKACVDSPAAARRMLQMEKEGVRSDLPIIEILLAVGTSYPVRVKFRRQKDKACFGHLEKEIRFPYS